MGRTKVPIKKIEGDRQRSTCFNKRKGGLFKKAMELSILCDVEVTLMVRSASGAYNVYSSESLDTALANYRRAVQVTSTNNRDYNRLFNKASAGAASDDEEEATGGAGKKKPSPAKKKAASGGKRKKKGSDDEEEYEDEDDDFGTEPPKREPSRPPAPAAAGVQGAVVGNAFLQGAGSMATSPGAGATDFSVFLPTSQWSSELDQHLSSSSAANGGAPPVPASSLTAPVVGASVVSDRRKPVKRQATKKTKKPGPALSLDTSQQAFVEIKSEVTVPLGSPPPIYMQGSGLTPTSGGMFLPSFGLGLFPPTPNV